MFGNRIEDEFANDIARSGDAVTRRGPGRLLLAITLGLAAFTAWAATHRIEESARAVGRVIPSSQVQVVQSTDGGVVRQIAVREGDTVSSGDVLMQIDDTRFDAQRGELLEREGALLAEKARVEAEAQQSRDLVFSPDLIQRAPLAISVEREVFLSRRVQFDREMEVLQSQLMQRLSDMEEASALRARTEAILTPLRTELGLSQGMLDRGLVPQVEVLRLQARVAELQGDITVSEARDPRRQAAVDETRNQMNAARSAYVLTARERLAKLQVELAVVQEALRAANDRVLRAQLTAPVRGTINRVYVSTIGAVVQPGAAVIEIVPADDSLLIEADLGPRDIAFVRQGEKASVKITAYDYLVYGALEGEVVRIGADTIERADGGEVFRVVIRTTKSHLGPDDDPLPITPGMVASVDIQTGDRTVLSYLAKPILRAQAEALRER
ncbi:MAG: HlyD family type I secretion periplasmic adaptor subunit [Roseobacter sp.]